MGTSLTSVLGGFSVLPEPSEKPNYKLLLKFRSPHLLGTQQTHLWRHIVGGKLGGHQVPTVNLGEAKVSQFDHNILKKQQNNR